MSEESKPDLCLTSMSPHDAEGPHARHEVKPSAHNTSSIPNGGVKAWFQVLGTFFIFFNTW